MALRCAAGDETGEVFDGVLAMDPNLEISTCYLTGMFSQLDPDNSSDLMDILRKVSKECETVEDWILIHDHVVNCVDKLQSDLAVLVRQCQDIANPFATVQPDQLSPFIEWFRQASENTSKVRCVFADDPAKRAMIANVRLKHLENGCLGKKFENEAFAFVPESRHMDLMKAEVFLKHMEDLLGSG
jgi:hypothetical protein